jgi:hypothetical protein
MGDSGKCRSRCRGWIKGCDRDRNLGSASKRFSFPIAASSDEADVAGVVDVYDQLRRAYAYRVGPNSSLAIGARRVVGYPPNPNGGGNCAGNCPNVSVAYHLRLKRAELYAAYAVPSALTTVPQMLAKLIFYTGTEKGV